MKKIIFILLFVWAWLESSLGQVHDSLLTTNPDLEYAFLMESGAFKHRLNIYYGNTRQKEDFLKNNPQHNISGENSYMWETMAAFEHLNKQGFHLISSYAIYFDVSGSVLKNYIFARPRKTKLNFEQSKNK